MGLQAKFSEDPMEASVLETSLAQKYQHYWRIGLAARIVLQEAPINGMIGNVCNQRLRCSDCQQGLETRSLELWTLA